MATDLSLEVVASLLRRGRALDQLSTGITLLGLLFGLVQLLLVTHSPVCLILSAWMVLLGLVQKYWALRVAFDAELFQRMASETEQLMQSTQAMDQALQSLNLQKNDPPARNWAERSRGALKLLRRQAQLLVVQVLAPLAVILASPWLPFTG
ncbi:hypothetical protein [Pseudomonas fluorescens]|uniref:Transmembrane protein n=1 Tax=Pseudomonas fluorescens TaxID=294 RepID=A0A5E7BRA6_PSEFL|nr:hypothetical protein [Pseudomonas fluorescens]VVN94698.1 hypothetical protein PS691_02146 [Pseudomonas fluorescens]